MSRDGCLGMAAENLLVDQDLKIICLIAQLATGNNRLSIVETVGQVGSLNFTRAVEGTLSPNSANIASPQRQDRFEARLQGFRGEFQCVE